MRSFTSSFDRVRRIRLVPAHPWLKVAPLAAVLALLFLLAWEAAVRSMGYGASYRDTPGLWGMSRDRLKSAGDDVVVIIGASRIRFDLAHESASEALGGGRVVNLSMNGSVVRPVLSHLAGDPDFAGIVLCGYTPGLFWLPGGPGIATTHEWLDAHASRTPSARAGQLLALGPESLFAFINEDLSLSRLIPKVLPLPDREGLTRPPELPPYIARTQMDRRERMWEKLETDPAFQERLKTIWRNIFSMIPPLPPELIGQLRGEVAADVRAIRDRGGDVLFLRPPSSGWLREFEAERFPRETHWDLLLEETGAAGIHFEDHPELAHFECPEWSHLSAGDAEEFSRALVPILRAVR